MSDSANVRMVYSGGNLIFKRSDTNATIMTITKTSIISNVHFVGTTTTAAP